MKKTFLVCIVSVSIAVVQAQDNKSTVTQPAGNHQVEQLAPPPPPLPPPPPPPPAPPLPPMPPVIINENGNEISIQKISGQLMVVVENDKKKQVIKLSTWNANRKYFEKKYGKLPPPPPPVPVTEEATFTAPVIKPDN